MAKKELTPEAIRQLKADLEKQEREAYTEFEKAQKAKREKALAAVIDPLKTERDKLKGEVAEANKRIGEIDKELESLTGTPAPKPAGKKKGTGTRRRLKPEEKLERAGKVHSALKAAKGEKLKAADLKVAADGVQLKELMEIWNAANKGEKISSEGKKAKTVYYVE